MTGMCQWSPDRHLNTNLTGLSTSATIAIQQYCRELSAAGRENFRLGLGQSPFPVPDLIVKALQDSAHQKDYLPVKGLPELREVLVERYRRVFGIDCGVENILVGPGSKELMFILQLVYDGEIMIPIPAWVSYLPQARIVGRPVRTIMTSAAAGWKVTPDQIEAICRSEPGRARLLILNYPSNPTGQTYSRDELAALTTVLRKYRILVLSDEIYGQLTFDDSHAPLVPLYPEGTIFSSGLSKWCGAGGWRLGFFIVPQCTTWLSDAMAMVASETYTSTSAPIQYAAIAAFQDHRDIDTYLVRCRAILHHLSRVVMKLLVPLDLSVLAPQGGFYVFPDFEPWRARLAGDGITTSRELCRRLLVDTGVAILPGSDFGRDDSELTARLAFVDFDGKAALDHFPAGGQVDDAFIESYCGRTVEAVRRLAAWLAER